MINSNIGQDWRPVCSSGLYEIPTDYVVIRVENKITKEQAYYDVAKGKLLTKQEAFDVLNGFRK